MNVRVFFVPFAFTALNVPEPLILPAKVALAVMLVKESVAPDWSSDGRIAFCGKMRGGRYGIYVASSSGAYSRVSPDDGASWEDPSWAPDCRHIVATRTAGGRRTLVILDSETGSKVELTAKPGEWYLADWAK